MMSGPEPEKGEVRKALEPTLENGVVPMSLAQPEMNEITRLQTKVDELKKELIGSVHTMGVELAETKGDLHVMTKQRDTLEDKLEAAYGSIREHMAICRTLQESEAALKVMVEQVRRYVDEADRNQTLEAVGAVWHLVRENPQVNLTAYNQKIERETIERCVERVDAIDRKAGEWLRNMPSAYKDKP